jgi:hypothetical protein
VLKLQAGPADVAEVLAVFVAPPAFVFLCCIGREWRKVRGELQAQAREDRTSRAEGFPPPGPPTTDSQVP